MSQEDVLEEGELLGQQLNPLLQPLVLLLELGDPVVRLPGPLPGLLARPLDGLVVSGTLGHVVRVAATGGAVLVASASAAATRLAGAHLVER